MSALENKIQVVDALSNQVLFECSLDDADAAFKEAQSYEEFGLDIKIIAPTVTDSLAISLGLSDEDKERLRQSSIDEIADHDGGCCVGPDGKPNLQ
jgi:hypothetical protein